MTIEQVLMLAAVDGLNNTEEETGGMILKHKDREDYKWAYLGNDNSGTEKAPVLFTPNADDYVEKVLSQRKEGYYVFASFHTHPTFTNYPSATDFTYLFPNHPVNYIYSIIDGEIAKYTWMGEDKVRRELVELLCPQKSESLEQAASAVG